MSVNTPLPQKQKPVQPDPHIVDVVKQKRDIEITRLKVDKAKLDVELKGYTEILEPIKLKSKGERLRSGVRSRAELEDEVRRLKAEADVEFKADPVGREKRYREIDEEARELL